MHERGSALAVRVRFPCKSCQVVTQLVVHTLDVVGVRFALDMALYRENLPVWRVMICTELYVAGPG